MALPWHLRGLIHKPNGTGYPVWGGIQAILWAIHRLKGSIDIDVHVTKDHVLVAVHWLKDWLWPDGRRVTGAVGDYTYAELQTMRPRRGGPWRIQSVPEIMAIVGGKIILCLETKPDPAFHLITTWARLREDADRTGARVLIMFIQSYGSTVARRQAWEQSMESIGRAAKMHFPVMLLARSLIDPRRWDFIDAWKGPRKFGRLLPATVAWVGAGSPWGHTERPKVRTPGLVSIPKPPPGPQLPKPDPRPPAPQEPAMPALDDRYDRTTRNGCKVDRWTAQALDAAQEKCGLTLTVTQGSWSTSVGASAGTHAGGGVVDLKPTTNPTKAVKALRECGFAAWHRKPGQGPWPSHIHAVLINNTQAAASAKRQVVAYEGGLNGLANNGPDDGPRVAPNIYPYRGIPKRRSTMNAVEYGRYLIKAGLDQLAKTDKPRPAVAAAAKAITKALKDMPSK